MKRFLAVLMALAMLATMIPAFAEVEAQAKLSGKCGDNATYKLTKVGTDKYGEPIYDLVISGKGKMWDYNFMHFDSLESRIQYEGLDPRKYNETPWLHDTISSVVIEKGITYIGECAFGDLNCLNFDKRNINVSIADSVTAIGDCAFLRTTVKDITIPKSVKKIGDSSLDFGVEDFSVYVYSDDVKYGEYVFGYGYEDGIIYGRKGSTTEKYCKKNGLHFELLEAKPVEKIILDKTEVTLEKGNSIKINAKVQPAGADSDLKWTSADKSIAKVNSKGKITAVNGGTTVITATAKDGSGVSAQVKVTVLPTQVTKISLNKKSATLKTGEKLKLTVKVTPDDADDKTITWKSSDPTIAKVNSKGKVTAVAPGKCVITATSANGKKASCKITVKAVKVSKITVNGKKNMKVGATQQLTAVISPENAYDKSVTWTSSDTAIATVDEKGIVTAVASGKVTITCKANDGSGKKASFRITVKEK